MPCKNCDHEVSIGELVEFHADTFPDEDTSIRESVLRKMEAGQDFDAAEDVFLNETLAAYAEKFDAPDGDADDVLARELALYAMNDAVIYRQRIEAFARTYGIRKAKGQFDKGRAIEGLANLLAKDVEKKYFKEVGGDKAPEMNKATKLAFGSELLEEMMEMIDDFADDIKAGRRDKRGQDILMKSPDRFDEELIGDDEPDIEPEPEEELEPEPVKERFFLPGGVKMILYGLSAGLGFGAVMLIFAKWKTTGNVTSKFTEGGHYYFEMDKNRIVRVDGAEYQRFNVGDSYTYQNDQVTNHK